MKRIILIIILILFTSSCATRRKRMEYNDLRGLMLLENTQLGKNKEFYKQKYYNPKKRNHSRTLKKR
jgi:PBP1b-binding outer membrane lipoprotein LpoB